MEGGGDGAGAAGTGAIRLALEGDEGGGKEGQGNNKGGTGCD